MDEEIKLYTKSSEREYYDLMAELYAIVISMDFLEKAYIRDSIPATEYTPACAKLLAQFKTALNSVLDNQHQSQTPTEFLDQFIKTYSVLNYLFLLAFQL